MAHNAGQVYGSCYALVGGVLAGLSGKDVASGAIGEGSAPLVARAIAKEMYGSDNPETLTQEQKTELSQLTSVAGGLLGMVASKGDAAAAQTAVEAAKNEVENNYLSHNKNSVPELSEVDQLKMAEAECSPAHNDACQRAENLRKLSARRNSILMSACAKDRYSPGCQQQIRLAENQGVKVYFDKKLGIFIDRNPASLPVISERKDINFSSFERMQGQNLLDSAPAVPALLAGEGGLQHILCGTLQKELELQVLLTLLRNMYIKRK
ncbi:hypothetical protein THUN1379_06760 [Paludibacterium sp. THUN1379]|uniref:VENN motif pre-toxin domain-containing protein n=1 Tax=Paludibacterium sp. THUN1379 TaxID=3112107 RepID=UPI00308C645B|nr:hypothetical protein THUN1379_06760 [Paludibacterium sp. THUN1379]